MPALRGEEARSFEPFPQFPIGQTSSLFSPSVHLVRLDVGFQMTLSSVVRLVVDGLERQRCQARVIRGALGQILDVLPELCRAFSSPACRGFGVTDES